MKGSRPWKRKTRKKKMKELEEAGDDAWEKVKDTADKILDDLKAGIARVVSYSK